MHPLVSPTGGLCSNPGPGHQSKGHQCLLDCVPVDVQALRLEAHQHRNLALLIVIVICLSDCKLIQDLENGVCQELIAFILILKQQIKKRF